MESVVSILQIHLGKLNSNKGEPPKEALCAL
jgi:hypothetical protein